MHAKPKKVRMTIEKNAITEETEDLMALALEMTNPETLTTNPETEMTGPHEVVQEDEGVVVDVVVAEEESENSKENLAMIERK